MAKLFWIKERHNPQLNKPYYTACGQITKKRAKEIEDSIYGDNYMLSFNTQAEYESKLETLKNEGFTVHLR